MALDEIKGSEERAYRSERVFSKVEKFLSTGQVCVCALLATNLEMRKSSAEKR